jgi:hypothetical protein
MTITPHRHHHHHRSVHHLSSSSIISTSAIAIAIAILLLLLLLFLSLLQRAISPPSRPPAELCARNQLHSLLLQPGKRSSPFLSIACVTFACILSFFRSLLPRVILMSLPSSPWNPGQSCRFPSSSCHTFSSKPSSKPDEKSILHSLLQVPVNPIARSILPTFLLF